MASALPAHMKPNESAIHKLLEKTGFSLIQENGQRKYGPPPNWEGECPARGCEVFVGKVPRDCFEDELIPVFERVGSIYEMRLMMDFSGTNRGFCFVTYTKRHEAKRAVKELNNFEIRKGRYLGICLSVDNCRLFVGGIPKTKSREEIKEEMMKITEGVQDVIVYPSALDKTKNRGFAFVEFESHKAAAMARRKLIPGKIQLWGHQIAVDWAEPEQEVDEDIMSKVKVLYVRNLMLSTTEKTLEEVFCNAVGKENATERVKKLRDYAFVHFREREDAIEAMHKINGQLLDGAIVEVTLAKPVDKTDPTRQSRTPAPGSSQAAPAYQLALPGGLLPLPMTTQPSVSNGGSISRPSAGRGRGRGAAGRASYNAQRVAVKKPAEMNGFLGMEQWVTIPALANHVQVLHQPKVSRTTEQSQQYTAANYVFLKLGYYNGMTGPAPTNEMVSPAMAAIGSPLTAQTLPTANPALMQGHTLQAAAMPQIDAASLYQGQAVALQQVPYTQGYEAITGAYEMGSYVQPGYATLMQPQYSIMTPPAKVPTAVAQLGQATYTTFPQFHGYYP